MPRARSTTDTPAKRLMRRALWSAVALGALWFAVEGGEFGTTDIYVQKARRARLKSDVDSLHAMVDSLQGELKAMSTDDARLERIAREQFGMVKGTKEVLYRVSHSADAAADRAVQPSRDSVVSRDTSEASPRG